MGVQKLWDILLATAISQHVEDLSGLTLAIDASLWIVKINSVFEKVDDGLKCIFNKILWLKKNNIRPVFVFDGSTPLLKRKTVEDRRNRKSDVKQFDLHKKVEIQIMKNLTGGGGSHVQKPKIHEQKSKQIQQMLETLLKFQQNNTSIEWTQKLALQGDILNKKYELYTQINPAIIIKFGDLDYFGSLDIQSKQQILTDVRQSGQALKQTRIIKQKMTQEEKIFYDMEIIQKKSKIRQLQDNLYRKLTTKRIQNGFEVIQGIYNGKKVIQKRKIKEKAFDYWDPLTKKKQCNDFKEIFGKEKITCKSSNQEHDDKAPDFFATIFAKDYTIEKCESSKSTFTQVSKRLSQSISKDESKQKNEDKKSNRQKIYWQSDNDRQEISYSEAFDVQPRQKKQNITEEPEQFPNFIAYQAEQQLCRSSANLHLQNMLDILGINYIVAPYEAQAQCAALQQLDLVDGVITQDSDVFLFGARRVYRGVFQDNIRLYLMNKIQSKLLLTRQKMVLFALMLGSDYTEGVKGIGIVNAMQILKIHHDFQSLQKFTNWAKIPDILQENQYQKTDQMLRQASCQDEIQFYNLHRKFKNYWHIHPNFPSKAVFDAYMQPPVQISTQVEKKVKQDKAIVKEGLDKLMVEKFEFMSLQCEINCKILQKSFTKTKQLILSDNCVKLAKVVSKRLKKAINLQNK